MSNHDVEFDDVCRRIAEFGARAALITVTDLGTPHVVSVVLEIGNGRLLARVGSRTRVNLLARPTLSLLWTPADDREYHLILDCVAEEIGAVGPDAVSAISISVSSGILHRLSDLPGIGPSCIVLTDYSSDHLRSTTP